MSAYSTEIYLADNPFSYLQSQKISLHDFIQKVGGNFSWSESYSIADNIKYGGQADLAVLKRIETELRVVCRAIGVLGQCAHESIVVCSLGILGFGVFARQEIHKGQVIGLYAGELKKVNPGFYPYGIGITLINAAKGMGEAMIIDAQYRRNITAFINHLPEPHELEEMQFNSQDLKDDVATANLTIKTVPTTVNIPIFVLKASQNILPGEQLGWSYGEEFWRTEGSPVMRLFSKTTHQLLPRSAYSYMHTKHSVDNKNEVFNFKASMALLIKHVEEDKMLEVRCGNKSESISVDKIKKLLASYEVQERNEIEICKQDDDEIALA